MGTRWTTKPFVAVEGRWPDPAERRISDREIQHRNYWPRGEMINWVVELEESCFWCVVNWRSFSISMATTFQLWCVLVLQNISSCVIGENVLPISHEFVGSSTLYYCCFASIVVASLYVSNPSYDSVSSMEDLRQLRVTQQKHMDRPSRAFFHQPECYPKKQSNRTHKHLAMTRRSTLDVMTILMANLQPWNGSACQMDLL